MLNIPQQMNPWKCVCLKIKIFHRVGLRAGVALPHPDDMRLRKGSYESEISAIV